MQVEIYAGSVNKTEKLIEDMDVEVMSRRV